MTVTRSERLQSGTHVEYWLVTDRGKGTSYHRRRVNRSRMQGRNLARVAISEGCHRLGHHHHESINTISFESIPKKNQSVLHACWKCQIEIKQRIFLFFCNGLKPSLLVMASDSAPIQHPIHSAPNQDQRCGHHVKRSTKPRPAGQSILSCEARGVWSGQTMPMSCWRARSARRRRASRSFPRWPRAAPPPAGFAQGSPPQIRQ